MKKFLVLAVIALLGGIFGMDSFAANKKIAVYVEGNITKEQKSIVNSAIMSRLSGNKEYRVFERNDSFLRALDHEHDYQLSGEVSESQIRKIGERLGVDYVIAVVVVITEEDKCTVSGRLIDLETGEVLKTCNATREYEDSSSLTALGNNIAYRLISKKSK